MTTQQQAADFLAAHGHTVHCDGGDRVVAECVFFGAGERSPFVEYGAFHAPFSAREMRDWLGY